MNTLSIIASSRFLCNEISHHLYARLNHEIRFWPTHEKNSWAAIKLSSQHLNLRRNVVDFKTLTRHIQSFPHHRVAGNILRVSIPPSSTKDPGRRIKLSLTANSLVDAIKDMQNAPHLIVTLVGNWLVRGDCRDSIYYWKDRDILGGHTDTQIVLVPFGQLNDWTCDLPPELWKIAFEGLAPGWFDGVNKMPLYGVPKSLEHPIESNIDNWLMDIRWFLDQELDEMEGPTAAYLRRERFRTWHTDGDSWKSLYGEQLLKDLGGQRYYSCEA